MLTLGPGAAECKSALIPSIIRAARKTRPVGETGRAHAGAGDRGDQSADLNLNHWFGWSGKTFNRARAPF
jgi:hypothetical protein